MRWKNYSFERVDGGVAITQYLGVETTADMLGGKMPGLLVGVEEFGRRGIDDGVNPDSGNEKEIFEGGSTANKEEKCLESLEDNKEGVFGGFGEELAVRVPEYIGGEPVIEIGKEAFSEYGSLLERIELPPTVRRIGEGAFKMCMSLEKLVLSEGVESIGAEAFYLTPLEEQYLPSTVCEIENPWELSGIRFRVSPENPWYSTDGYGLYREKELLVVCSQEAHTEYTVAAGTTRIAENAFAANPDLEKVILPQGVRVIGETAFEGCQNLEEVVLPEGLVEIGVNAFSHCIRLREMHLPSTLARLGAYALSDTFGWSDTLNGLEKISVAPGNHIFYADVYALFQNVFHAVSAECDEKDQSGSDWGEHLVRDVSNEEEREKGCFQAKQEQKKYMATMPIVSKMDCDDQKLRHSETMSAATFAMQQTGIKIVKYFGHERSYVIPDGVTEIGESACRRADFHVVSVPKTLKNVGEDAFRECTNLEEIFFEETGARIYVPHKPIYRKDEITALFYCAEREERLRGREKETYDLPEKWQSFARTPIYSGKREDAADVYGQYVFDYRGYDALFHTYLNLPDQYGMALCRLQFPVLLSAEVRGKYEDFLWGHFTEILESLADTEDMVHLAALAELGFFTAENMEDSLDVFNRKRRTKQMSYLLDYKREHLEWTDFDFSL